MSRVTAKDASAGEGVESELLLRLEARSGQGCAQGALVYESEHHCVGLLQQGRK